MGEEKEEGEGEGETNSTKPSTRLPSGASAKLPPLPLSAGRLLSFLLGRLSIYAKKSGLYTQKSGLAGDHLHERVDRLHLGLVGFDRDGDALFVSLALGLDRDVRCKSGLGAETSPPVVVALVGICP